MEEQIGRETLQELIKLQINILTAYQVLLESGERARAKEAVNKVVKAAIEAVGPLLTLEHLAYDGAVTLHEHAVGQTRNLLEKLLKEEQSRAKIHEEMREQAARHGRPK